MEPIRLDLSDHCVETEMKRLYDQSISQYLKAMGSNDLLEHKIEVLEKAMEAFDFSDLRSMYPELAGNSSATVFLVEEDPEQIALLVNGKSVEP